MTARSAARTNPFSSLALFNALTPKDGAGRLVKRGLSYGPHRRHRLDLYAPRRTGTKLSPLLVFFYGGGWNSGTRSLYGWVGRAFAARGLGTAIPDYRLVPEAHFPEFLEDAALAVAEARKAAPKVAADPDRILLAGQSAGAYLAIMLALDRRYLERAGVDPDFVRAAAGLAGPYDFHPFDVPASINAFGRAPDPLETQPVTFARADAPPLFLGHGSKDHTVRLANSAALARAVQEKGGKAELRVYPGLGHADTALALSVPFRRRAPVLDDVMAFFIANA